MVFSIKNGHSKMTNFFYRILLTVFNLFGILNLKVTKTESIRNSKLFVSMNFAKLIILLWYNNFFKTVIDGHYLADYPSNELTTFAEVFFSVNSDYMMFNTIMFLSLQIWKRKDIFNVIEEMMHFRNLFIQKYKVAEKLYNQVERRCMKDILLFLFVTLGVFANDFVCNMNLNFKSLASYAIYSLPYMTIILMTLVAYLSIQFIRISQEILIQSLSEDSDENSIVSSVEDIGYEIRKLNSLFSRINYILNIQISLLLLYYLSETIVQV